MEDNNANNKITNAMASKDKSTSFRNIFNTTIMPQLEPLEKYRLEQRHQTILYEILLNIAIVCLIFIFKNTLIEPNQLISNVITQFLEIWFVAAVVLGLCLWTYKDKKFKITLKTKILKPITQLFGTICWTEKNIITIDEIKHFGFCPEAQDENPDDAFQGKLEDVSTKIQEISLSHQHGKTSICDFKGIAIILSLNKNFTGKTIVKHDAGEILGKNLNAKTYDNLEHVALESINFEKEFEVYSSDQVEARYLLTTSFMEKLENLKKHFDAEYIECGFYQGEILILLHTYSFNNFFEIGNLSHSLKDISMFETTYNELSSVINIIKYLKLNIKTGL